MKTYSVTPVAVLSFLSIILSISAHAKLITCINEDSQASGAHYSIKFPEKTAELFSSAKSDSAWKLVAQYRVDTQTSNEALTVTGFSEDDYFFELKLDKAIGISKNENCRYGTLTAETPTGGLSIRVLCAEGITDEWSKAVSDFGAAKH